MWVWDMRVWDMRVWAETRMSQFQSFAYYSSHLISLELNRKADFAQLSRVEANDVKNAP